MQHTIRQTMTAEFVVLVEATDKDGEVATTVIGRHSAESIAWASVVKIGDEVYAQAERVGVVAEVSTGNPGRRKIRVANGGTVELKVKLLRRSKTAYRTTASAAIAWATTEYSDHISD